MTSLRSRLVADVLEGLRVLQRQGVRVTDGQLIDRARNIVAGLLGNYRIEDFDNRNNKETTE